MGHLRNFDLRQYGCNVYVETGTGAGLTLGKAAASSFNRLFSVDMDAHWVNEGRKRFPGAVIENDLSIPALERWLREQLSPQDRVLFFLDAHFPGADYRGAKYDVAAPNAVPLREELELIVKYREGCSDYIICDDARIYMIGPFAHGNTPLVQVSGGLRFVFDMFGQQRVAINYEEEGYIVIDRRS